MSLERSFVSDCSNVPQANGTLITGGSDSFAIGTKCYAKNDPVRNRRE